MAKTAPKKAVGRPPKVQKGAAKAKAKVGLSKLAKVGAAKQRAYTDEKGWHMRRRVEQPPPGGWPKNPPHWPDTARVDVGRPEQWLPEGWGQGIKLTCASRLKCFISPEGKMFYHRKDIEKHLGFEAVKTKEGQLAWARERAVLAIKNQNTYQGQNPPLDGDDELLASLSNAERKHLKTAKDFHWAVISARRADHEKGMRSICAVEASLRRCGAAATWYVDGDSVPAYRDLGLNAKVGGKLVEARNMALDDAKKARKPCVQVSDDISAWSAYFGDWVESSTGMDPAQKIRAGNDAAKAARRLSVSPGAVAQYLLAKMRAVPGKGRPRLGGVFPLANTGQAFLQPPFANDKFILGDFFVADLSEVRFDPRMTLKEDYDFTCTHLDTHGSVLRAAHILISVLHETNQGGAVSLRDDSGEKERQNIRVLQEKWPGVFRINTKRGDTQVILSWRSKRRPSTGGA